ncbi:hypothetical protein [Alicyclobacillus macrosporangiidus]|uniref:hypothetical protein n=1 Tax=Alicyclobacillus macrosporangiidus TaxID=392015 RepID=UPI000497AE27|nr:hypothetical protein [Alicyclobacillus macrosporangiidus]
MGYTASWVGHIVAGLLGTLLSVSVFYKTLERWFAVHRKLDAGRVLRILDPSGRALSQAEVEAFVLQFNEASFLGVNRHDPATLPGAWRVELEDGQTVLVAPGERFVDVVRMGKGRKPRRYWLLDLPMVKGGDAGVQDQPERT